MTFRLFCLLAPLAAACAPAFATPVYKCVSEAGKVTYSQNPCYGENWHRFGERRAPGRSAAAPAAPATATNTSGTEAGGKAAGRTTPAAGSGAASAATAATSATTAAAIPAAAASAGIARP